MDARELLSGPPLRRALARSGAFALGLGGAALLLSRGAPASALPSLVAFPLLYALVVGGPSGWLEARGQERPGQSARGLLHLALLPSLLSFLTLLQVRYLRLVLDPGQEGRPAAVLQLLRSLEEEPGTYVLLSLLLGLPLALATCRRAALGSLAKTGAALFWLSVIACGAGFPFLFGWALAELLCGMGDALERLWVRVRAERGSLAGLPRGRVWLLAYLGHPEAQRLLGGDAPYPPDDLPAWLRGLEPAGGEALQRALLASMRRIVREGPPAPGWEASHAAWLAWSEDPTAATAAAVREALRLAPPAEGPRERALRLLGDVLRPEPWGRASALGSGLARLGDAHEVREEVTSELLEWALAGRTDQAGPQEVR